jgi:uncharacterized protein YbjT (DUF2867 family)
MYVVVGASGNTGRIVAERLLEAGKPVTVLGRHAQSLSDFEAKGARVATGSLDDTAFLTQVFKGATGVYGLIPPSAQESNFRDYQNRLGLSFIQAVKDSGVKHVVFLSSIGAHSPETGVVAGAYDLETNFKKVSDVNVLFLRAGFFMQNFYGNIGLIKGMGINGGLPIEGDIKIAMVHTNDIGEVAARRLLHLDFSGQSYTYLSGPELHSFEDATRIIGTAIGKPELPWFTFPYDQAKAGMMQMGFSESLADAYIQFGKATNEGILNADYEHKAEYLQPTSLKQFIEHEWIHAYNNQ